jgi:hypothetical protein
LKINVLQRSNGDRHTPGGQALENHNERRFALTRLLAVPLGLAGIAAVSPSLRAAEDSHKEMEKMHHQAIENLVARQQITDVLYSYARGWDRRDEALIRSCFWPDSTHQHGAFNGKSQDFVTAGWKATSTLKGCSHLIANPLVAIQGDKAISECQFLSHHRRDKKTGDGEEYWYLKGRYLDRFERRDGVWKIAHRRGLHDWSQTLAPTDEYIAKAAPDAMSRWKPDDPLYALLAELK